MAPANRKDFFLGSVNYHWSIDKGKVKVSHGLRYLTSGLQATSDRASWYHKIAPKQALRARIVYTSTVQTPPSIVPQLTSGLVSPCADLACTQLNGDAGSPVKYNDYKSWGVEHDDYFVNSYVL